LFFESNTHPFSAITLGKPLQIITSRDRLIVATVIQWLGSNCGMSFLHEALKRFNATVVYNKAEVETSSLAGD